MRSGQKIEFNDKKIQKTDNRPLFPCKLSAWQRFVYYIKKYLVF